MTETEYTRLAEDTLRKLEQAIELAIEHTEVDFDYEFSEGGILQIEFANDTVIVVNKQAAAQEIWVAAKSGGFHFRWDGNVWRDTRSNEELFAALSRLASEQSGAAVTLH
jgi:CyaY protein